MFSLGIDLGTGNTAAAFTGVSDGKINTVVIPLSGNKRANSMRSAVAFDGSDRMFSGKDAERLIRQGKADGAVAFKTRMGTEYLYQSYGKFHSPVELSAIVLENVKKNAEAFLNDRMREAVIAVPARFGQNQRNATVEAATIAGIKVKQLVSEPTAAAIAYRSKNPSMDGKTMLVFDMGAGTTDVSVVHVNGRNFAVLGTYGNTHLGGNDIDNAIVEKIKAFLHGRGLKTYPEGLEVLAEQLKIKLSGGNEAQIRIPGAGGKSGQTLYSMSAIEMNEIIQPLLPEIFRCIDMAISTSGIGRRSIDVLLLTGGQMRMPQLRMSIEDYLSMKSAGGINPETAVATGASIIASGYAYTENGNVSRIRVQDVVPMTLGSVILNDIVIPMIPANSRIPCSATRPFTTIRDYQKEIEVRAVQGERPMGSDNIQLGKFILTGIKAAPRGEVSVDVTYSVDKNGILTVSATDRDTGSHKEIKIENSMQHSPEEIREMKEKVRAYFKRDAEMKKMAEVMNRAEDLLHRLKVIANEQLSSGTVYYNVNTDILRVSRAIKAENVKLLSQLVPKLEKEYKIIN
ncbi:MAG: Hsp70 family protein [Ferroplasma sp.]|uniref:Hsp70 family protein n=1 Tax=Ferroplasma sp. TaxID=2591003 RepID=UPI0028158B3A|nr:Hsp70 family protein [Ferroplasma sp.]WMT50677.1 MAG: Hsp70 family protein [Ferroplasma sp.]